MEKTLLNSVFLRICYDLMIIGEPWGAQGTLGEVRAYIDATGSWADFQCFVDIVS